MNKIDRTGETTTNIRSQRCKIVAYRNNKDIAVEIVDFAKNRFIVLEHQRYTTFAKGKIYFDASMRGEAYICERKPQVPSVSESHIVAPAFDNIVNEQAQGKAIGITLGIVLIMFLLLLAAMLISFL